MAWGPGAARSQQPWDFKFVNISVPDGFPSPSPLGEGRALGVPVPRRYRPPLWTIFPGRS